MNEDTKMILPCLLCILFAALAAEVVELGLVSSVNANSDDISCATTLFTWAYVSTIIGILSNGFFLLFFSCFMCAFCKAFKGKSDSSQMTCACFCIAGSYIVSCVVCIFVVFRIGWFGYGIALMTELDDQCIKSIGPAHGGIIAGLIAMVVSAVAKMFITCFSLMIPD